MVDELLTHRVIHFNCFPSSESSLAELKVLIDLVHVMSVKDSVVGRTCVDNLHVLNPLLITA
jgi:hypothetical protein